MTNTPARFMYNTYGALVNWRNYTEGDLNLKWPNWGSFDIPKLIFFLHEQFEKVGVHLLISREAVTSFMVTSDPHD